MSNLGPEVRRLRTQAGLTQSALADRIGTTAAYVCLLENQRISPPSERVLRTMAEVFAVDADWLIALANKIPRDLTDLLHRDPALWPAVRELTVQN